MQFNCVLSLKMSQVYFSIDAFLEVYETEVALSDTEKKAIPLLMPCIELLFVAYFTNKKMPESTDAAIQLYRFLLQNDSEL